MFRMELDTEIRAISVTNTLIAAIVGVDKEFVPVMRKSLRIDGVSVVLGCDIASSGNHVRARDVGTTVAVLHLHGVGAGSSGEQLVSKTDAEDGDPGFVHGCFDVPDGRLHHGGVTWTVRDEQTVIVLACQLREVIVPGHDLNLNSAPHKTSQLVELEANVNNDYTDGAAGGMFEGVGRVGRIDLGRLSGNYLQVRGDIIGTT